MNAQKLRLLPINNYLRPEDDDPLPMYYLPFFGPLYRGRIELCLSGLQPGKRILEVGYGSGTTFLNLADMYEEIHGVDLHTNGDIVQNTFERVNIPTKLCTGSLLNLPYPDTYFDALLCISILEHLHPEEQDRAMAEVRRVLVPGGRFVYGVPVERPLMQLGFRTLGYDIRRYHFSTERDVEQTAAQHLRKQAIRRYTPFGKLIGPLYEVGIYDRV